MTDEDKGIPLSIALWGILAILAAATAILLAFAAGKDTDVGTSQGGTKAVPVRVVTVAARDIVDTVTLSARVEPAATVRLSAEKAGRVVELLVDKGDRVKAGQVLLRIDDATWRSILARAEVVQREAEKDFGRWEKLKKTGSVSDSDFDAVAKARDLARVGLDQAKTDLAKCEVETPISGIVDDRYVEVGEYVHEGGPVLKVVDIDSVKIALDVPERDVLAVKTGTTVKFSLSALSEREFAGEVTFVASAADALSNSFRTEITVRNPDHAIKGGMIAEVQLERGIRKNVVVVALATIVNRKGEHVVFVVKGERAERRVVAIEPVSSHQAVILSGLEPGEQMVVEGHRSLEDGVALDIVE